MKSASCPCSDATRAPGWSSEATLKGHVDAHLAGLLAGDVPEEWLAARRRHRCAVCGLSVAARFGVHPTCRPAARDAAPAVHTGDGGALPGASAQPGLPTLADIQAAGTATLRHIPARARALWNQVFTRALSAVVSYNTERCWAELLMLPQAVLCAPGRGGRKHQKAVAAYTLDRLHRWDEGERASLWESRPTTRRQPRLQPSDAEKQDLALSLAREGFDGKACAALVSAGLCPPTADTLAALKALHPSQVAPDTPALAQLPVPPTLEPDFVRKALESFPAATAPGPSGLRIQHIREAVSAGGDCLLDQLALLVNLLAQGRAPLTVAPVLAGAGLVALQKPGGGVRPIAVGEILRRLTGKCLMQLVRPDARAYLWPQQSGVGVKAGAEAAVHTLRAWLQRHESASDKVVVKLDFRNAFNTVDRTVVLREARAQFPALARWATWCYHAPSTLRFGQEQLLSCAGVQQGDPLGPLLFATALQPLLWELHAGPLDLCMFYLDDGLLAGDVDKVAAALAHVQQHSARLGLSLNLAKSEVAAVGRTLGSAVVGRLPNELVLSPAGANRVVRDFDFLGAGIGSADHVEAHALARVQQASALLDAIAVLPDPQVALRLLRHCSGFSRLVHTMRCCPLSSHSAALTHYDKLVQTCLSSFTGLHLTDSQWRQACRGLAHAGLGLRSVAAHAPAAYLASVGGCAVQCGELDAAYDLHSGVELRRVLSDFNAQLPDVGRLSLDVSLGKPQRQLSSLLDKAAWEAQLAAARPAERAALLSEGEVGARAFLAAVPHGRVRMEPSVFVTELRARLGVAEATVDMWCPLCDAVLDTHSHHAAMCVAGGERVQRHNALRDLVALWAEQGGLQPEKEKAGLLLPNRPDEARTSHRRPADVYLPAFNGAPTALDFAVTATQRLDALQQVGVGGAAAAAVAYTEVKRQHLNTAAACASSGIHFLPLVVETTGAWAPEAQKALNQIARSVALRRGEEASSTQARFFQEACVLVRTFRARAVLRRRAALAVDS